MTLDATVAGDCSLVEFGAGGQAGEPLGSITLDFRSALALSEAFGTRLLPLMVL